MAERTQMLSHWAQQIEGLAQSVQEFYDLVEAAIRERRIPGISMRRVWLREGGLFSSSRQYLRVSRKDLRYDIGAAPLANGFFISARLIAEGRFSDDMLGAMARGGFVAQVVAGITARLTGVNTYMKIDIANAYLQLVHRALLDAVDEVTDRAQLPPLAPADRRPVLDGFFLQS